MVKKRRLVAAGGLLALVFAGVILLLRGRRVGTDSWLALSQR